MGKKIFICVAGYCIWDHPLAEESLTCEECPHFEEFEEADFE
jgi:hypothetical protein